MKKYKNTDEYIENFSGVHKMKLIEIRAIIQKTYAKNKKINKKIIETIKYGMPTFVYVDGKISKNICFFGGFKNHISFFPGGEATTFFEKDLAKFIISKGTIQLPLEQKLPQALLIKISIFCLKRILEKLEK